MGSQLGERHDVVVGAHVPAALRQLADASVAVAVVGHVKFERRRTTAHERTARIDAGAFAVGDQGAVEDRHVRRVDAAFERLQPTALLDDFRDMAVAGWHPGEGERWRWRHLLSRPHKGPHDAAQLEGRVVLDVDLVGEAVFAGLVHLIDTVAVNVVFPAVVDAAQAALFVPAEPQRDAAVRAELVEQADPPLGVTEGNESFAEGLYSDWLSVRLCQLAFQQDRHPVAPQHLAHRRSRSRPGDQLVVLATQHAAPPRSAILSSEVHARPCHLR